MTREEFCAYKRPWGLGVPIEKLEPYAMAAFAPAADEHSRPANSVRPKDDKGRFVKGEPSDCHDNPTEGKRQANSTTGHIARLKRERDRGDEQATELLTKVEAGELTPLILDGRNRLRAAHEACIRPEFTDYEGDDPVGFVVSLNVKRRHLNESQRAMAAAAGIRDGVFGDTQNAANVFRIGLRGVYEAMDILGVERPDEHGRGRPRTDSAPRKERHASD